MKSAVKQLTRPVGRPAKLYQCLNCKAILGAAAMRSHKCAA